MDEWQSLARYTAGKTYIVERIRIPEENVAIEGSFELPPLARLSLEDQVFAAAFIRAHGSIKQMEESYGLSYPTIKNRLKRLSEELSFLDIEVRHLPLDEPEVPAGPRESQVGSLLDKLDAGELSVQDVLAGLGPAHETNQYQ